MKVYAGNGGSDRQHGLVNKALFGQSSSIVAEENSLIVSYTGVNANTLVSSMKPLYVQGPTLPVHVYTGGYSLSSLIFFSWIHLLGLAKRSPNLCIVVSMKLLLS